MQISYDQWSVPWVHHHVGRHMNESCQDLQDLWVACFWEVTRASLVFRIWKFYLCFIQHYAYLCRALTPLTIKVTQFVWSGLCQASFWKLKIAFSTALILILCWFGQRDCSRTDSSNIASASILYQPAPDGHLHRLELFLKNTHRPNATTIFTTNS